MAEVDSGRALVLGSPISHSLSPVLHNAGYEALGLDGWSYDRLECDAEALPGVVESAPEEVRGFSVTMPGKFAALKTATEATERARRIGAANTLVRVTGGWLADNTDVDGVDGALGELLGEDTPSRALVIGAGGTARPAIVALAARGVREIAVINRSDRAAELSGLIDGTGAALEFHDFGEDLQALAYSVGAIVSTVPKGSLDEHQSRLLGHAPVLDVVYDPWPTRLAVAAASNGRFTVGGHVMLAYQAYTQFELFTGRPAPRQAMWRALKAQLG